jgi:hypothetical protein
MLGDVPAQPASKLTLEMSNVAVARVEIIASGSLLYRHDANKQPRTGRTDQCKPISNLAPRHSQNG